MARRQNYLSSQQVDLINGNIQPIPFENLFDIFLDDCDLRNLRPDTQRYYRNELQAFKKVLTEQNIDPTPNNITKSIIQKNFIQYSIKQGLKTSSINTRLRAIRAFFNYLYKYEHIELNPVSELQLLSNRREVVETFSKTQINHLLKQVNFKTFTGVRDYTIMLLLLETGIRANECVNLNVDDIRWEDSMIVIRHTKNHRQRLVPFTAKMRKSLDRWLALRGVVETRRIFITVDDTPLSRRQLYTRLRQYGELAKINNVRVSAHTFRHTFAKYCVEQGASIFDLQKLLGHSSMEMVRTYVNMFSTEVRDNHRSFSPLRFID
ncbi:tyrosine-type recombinase/integrase [Thalassobacillus pellis]|uniref:tyrosine-type recombinase/integrase n=1 Tax=Thalassobacillus pellis TaxID=748008 RepID=UPI0019613A43|nr:tyrosine-type recombinase/integrase [Thalassobacillus pellis]MBM7554905.1 integrase/recombinase XerD [Thalassobacillus pellis]